MGKVYAAGFDGHHHDLVEVHIGDEWITNVFCGYDTAVFFTSTAVYVCGTNLSSIKVCPKIRAYAIKSFSNHVSSRMCTVYENDTVYLIDKRKIDEAPPLATGETIVYVTTGYNFTVMVCYLTFY